MPSSRRVAASKSPSAARKVKDTLLIKINTEKPETEKIQLAAKVIKEGGLVAFPTETVYGLGADALNAKAVEKIFAAKKRPPDNPIIVHVASKKDVYRLATNVPKSAEKLMVQFWPGPLTLILKRSELVPDTTVVGLDTIAIRMPNNEVALALIRESDTPIAAPSANLASRPSPTTAQHVMDDLAGRIDLVLDAGPTRIGVESTVLDMTTPNPVVLRPGGTSYEELKKLLGKVDLHPTVVAKRKTRTCTARSPGMKHRHYAPKAEMVVVEGKPEKVVIKIRALTASLMAKGKKVGVLATNENQSNYDANVVKSLGSRNDLDTVAKSLFRLLREFDQENVDIIIAEGIAAEGLGLAVMNRLRRAANFNVMKAS